MLPIYTKKVDKLSSNARNWPFFIKLKKGLSYPAAVWAQEAYESQYKMNPFNLFKFLFSDEEKRKVELMGHEIEVQVARIIYDDQNEDVYRYLEAIIMRNGYGGLFNKYSVSEIELLMQKNRQKAINFVIKHFIQIEKWK